MYLQNFLNCVFAKYTIQVLLLYSLNPTFSIGDVKNCTQISHFVSATGGKSPDPYRALTLDATRDFRPRPPDPASHHLNPLHCKILGTPMYLGISELETMSYNFDYVLIYNEL